MHRCILLHRQFIPCLRDFFTWSPCQFLIASTSFFLPRWLVQCYCVGCSSILYCTDPFTFRGIGLAGQLVFHYNLGILETIWIPWIWFGLHPWDLEILKNNLTNLLVPLTILSHNHQNHDYSLRLSTAVDDASKILCATCHSDAYLFIGCSVQHRRPNHLSLLLSELLLYQSLHLVTEIIPPLSCVFFFYPSSIGARIWSVIFHLSIANCKGLPQCSKKREKISASVLATAVDSLIGPCSLKLESHFQFKLSDFNPLLGLGLKTTSKSCRLR